MSQDRASYCGITRVLTTCATSAQKYAEQQQQCLLWRENHYIEKITHLELTKYAKQKLRMQMQLINISQNLTQYQKYFLQFCLIAYRRQNSVMQLIILVDFLYY